MGSALTVDLGDRSYPIVIENGSLNRLKDIISEHAGAEHIFCVTDENVMRLFEDRITDIAPASRLYVCPAGEGSKSFSHYKDICERFLAAGLTRGSTIVAFGGGVVGDLAGFAAATLMRGVSYVQVPTTLLAQVDSSVGGKTAINTAQGKNLVGCFYQPKAVVVDPETLASLPDRELRAGYAEVLKYALIDDAPFFDWLNDNGRAVMGRDKEALVYAVNHSCAAKARVVAQDEREGGVRALLNLGHTFGHALEKEAGYNGDLLHGEAVLIGMHMALDFSVSIGKSQPDDLKRLEAHYNENDLWPAYSITSDAGVLLEYMRGDKKARADQVVLILMKGIGASYIDGAIVESQLKEFLADYLKRHET